MSTSLENQVWPIALPEIIKRHSFQILDEKEIQLLGLPYDQNIKLRGHWARKDQTPGFLRPCYLRTGVCESLASLLAKPVKARVPEIIAEPLDKYTDTKYSYLFAFCFSPLMGTSPTMLKDITSTKDEATIRIINRELSLNIPFQIYLENRDIHGENFIYTERREKPKKIVYAIDFQQIYLDHPSVTLSNILNYICDLKNFKPDGQILSKATAFITELPNNVLGEVVEAITMEFPRIKNGWPEIPVPKKILETLKSRRSTMRNAVNELGKVFQRRLING